MADPEDLTARARIRDAALKLFAERGIDGTTIRQIATEAGVSLGLVRHHFGSKEELRRACDQYVIERSMRLKEQAILGGELRNPSFLGNIQPEMLPFYRYLARAMLDGSAEAGKVYDDMVDLAVEWIEKYLPVHATDSRAMAAFLVAGQIGMLAMREHMSRVLGADIFSPRGHLRMVRGAIDLYSQPLLSPEQIDQAYRALDELEPRLRRAEEATRPYPPSPPRSTDEGATS